MPNLLIQAAYIKVAVLSVDMFSEIHNNDFCNYRVIHTKKFFRTEIMMYFIYTLLYSLDPFITIISI